uniref:Trafficking protein particle complex subunit n=1 Tax=Phaeocystis antarctica TaxID=33657 RepID=A0A7S0EDU9_9EUKA|mmetsp:Transcript_58457/g.140286  ORF Transcript_58457/g.140286 Transcript_58457/m.140286 type:complete len:137 (-) Transcript_58457:40-450(-)
MAVFCLYIFSKQGVCLYYREWNRPLAPSDIRQDQKLMFGFLFSLKQLVAKMSPKKGGGFYACSTNTFKLNYYEPPSGLRFILTTDLSAGDMRESLRHIYSNIYVESLSKNPLWKPDEELTCPLFTQTLERYIATIS